MTWVDLSSAFGYGAVLTSLQMQNLRDNITAQANGDSGSPQQQTAGIADYAVTCSKTVGCAAGSLAIYSVANDKGNLSIGSYGKCCEIVIGFVGIVTISFDLYAYTGGTLYGRVYKNGIAAGSIHSQAGPGTGSFSDDVAVGVGDLLQVYADADSIYDEVQKIEISADTIISGHIAEVKV